MLTYPDPLAVELDRFRYTAKLVNFSLIFRRGQYGCVSAPEASDCAQIQSLCAWLPLTQRVVEP
jgi:hypothetical protein